MGEEKGETEGIDLVAHLAAAQTEVKKSRTKIRKVRKGASVDEIVMGLKKSEKIGQGYYKEIEMSPGTIYISTGIRSVSSDGHAYAISGVPKSKLSAVYSRLGEIDSYYGATGRAVEAKDLTKILQEIEETGIGRTTAGVTVGECGLGCCGTRVRSTVEIKREESGIEYTLRVSIATDSYSGFSRD